MLAIKLKRIGKKGQPSYRVVVQEARSKVHGPYVEDLGWFEPMKRKSEVAKDRLEYWIKCGAKPTEAARRVFAADKLMTKMERPAEENIDKK